jgi:hypothetical protein
MGPRPKMIGADHLVLAKKKASGILLPNTPSRIGAFPVFSDEFPVRAKRIPCSVENREFMRNALGLQHKSRQGALQISLLSGN